MMAKVVRVHHATVREVFNMRNRLGESRREVDLRRVEWRGPTHVPGDVSCRRSYPLLPSEREETF